jgi:hypothetical protein
MPGAYEGMGNPFAHISQANETDIHDLTPFVDLPERSAAEPRGAFECASQRTSVAPSARGP